MPLSHRTRTEILAQLPVIGTCFECGNAAHCKHHVVPESLGGTKTVPLCLVCHGKVHERDFVKHRCLQVNGISAALSAALLKRDKKAQWTGPERRRSMAGLAHLVN